MNKVLPKYFEYLIAIFFSIRSAPPEIPSLPQPPLLPIPIRPRPPVTTQAPPQTFAPLPPPVLPPRPPIPLPTDTPFIIQTRRPQIPPGFVFAPVLPQVSARAHVMSRATITRSKQRASGLANGPNIPLGFLCFDRVLGPSVTHVHQQSGCLRFIHTYSPGGSGRGRCSRTAAGPRPEWNPRRLWNFPEGTSLPCPQLRPVRFGQVSNHMDRNITISMP